MTDQQQQDQDEQQFLNDIYELERLGLVKQVGDGRWIITPGGSAEIAPCDDEPDEHEYYLTPKGREFAPKLIDNENNSITS